MTETRADIQSNNSIQKLKLAENFFQLESEGSPGKLIDEHEKWLSEKLEEIGVDGTKRHLHSIQYYNEIPNKSDSPILAKIYEQAQATSENIATGLIWLNLPQYASWKVPPTITIPAKKLLIDYENISNRIAQNANRWYDHNESYKSPLVGYSPPPNSTGNIVLTVNEHHEGPRGKITVADHPKQTEIDWNYLPDGNMIVIKPTPRTLTGWFPTYNRVQEGSQETGFGDVVDSVYGIRLLHELLIKLREADVQEKPNGIVKTFRAY